MSEPLSAENIALIMGDPAVHFTACTRIKMKDGVVRKPDKPNALQVKLFMAYLWLMLRGLPINIIILKARQVGGSEGTAELCYVHSRRFNLSGFMMADQRDRTDKIWNLFCQKAGPGMDAFEPYWGNDFKHNAEQATITYKDEQGLTCKAVWDRGTANDKGAGAAGTRQIVWLSESARYAKDGAFLDVSVIGNALNSIPSDLPNTMRIAESTGEGAGGWHHDTFEGAVDLDERMAGKVGNGWVRIFLAWHEHAEYALTDLPQHREYFDDADGRWAEHAADEEAGRILYEWTAEQIAWRRRKILGDLGGDAKLFKRDYPASPAEAWASSGSKRFNVVAMAHMLKAATELWKRTMAQDPLAPKIGGLIDGAGGAVWTWTPEDSWLWVCEEPKYGMRYALIVDPMTGEQAAGTDKPDNHAPGVIRHEYIDKEGVLHPAEIVACIHVANGCQWDMDVLADRIALLAKWYGNCLVIPEVNKAMDLVVLLRARHVQLYLRKARPDVNNPSERQQVVGFYTSEATRKMWVTSAAEAIREGSVICRYLPAVKEFDSFLLNTRRGRAEASPGAHDDWVAMYGIACLCREAATPMRLPTVPEMPWNLRRRPPGRGGSLGSGAIG